MKKNAIIKIVTIILISFTIINYISTVSKASFVDNVFKSGKEFLEGEPETSIREEINGTKIIGISKDIYNFLLTLGIIIAVVLILVLGIQFMTGSIEQKSKVKEMLVPFIVGCVIVFGSLTIWQWVVKLGSSVI